MAKSDKEMIAKVIGTTEAIISKVSTTVDGGLSLSVAIPGSDDKELASKLLQLALNPESIFVTFVKKEK